jgi:ferredoxin-thioredoxin reductase catalytic subunit/glutaredoxin
MAPQVKVYALSTCIHCKKAKEYLDQCGVKYDCVHVDLLTGQERKDMVEEVKKVNPSSRSPPSSSTDRPSWASARTRSTRRSRMNAEQLYAQLKKLQEPKGYFFNPDMSMTMPLKESLAGEQGPRLGYMACPCRLANGTFEADRDIVCPCEYREADVAEFGACFCGLNVSKGWIEGRLKSRGA